MKKLKRSRKKKHYTNFKNKRFSFHFSHIHIFTILTIIFIIIGLPLFLYVNTHPQTSKENTLGATTSQCQGLWIPAFFGPGASWNKVVASYPATKIVTANVNNGPGSSVDSSWASAIAQAKAAGIRVAGYVNTGHGSISPATVKAEIDQWKSLYNVTDIMFDNAWAPASFIPYYQDLTNYVHQTPGAIDQLGAGDVVDEGYMQAGDVIDMFEGSYTKYQTWHTASWVSKYPATRFKVDIYGIPGSSALQSLFNKLSQDNFGYMELTDSTNPWRELGSDTFFNALVSQVKTSCSSTSGTPPPSGGVSPTSANTPPVTTSSTPTPTPDPCAPTPTIIAQGSQCQSMGGTCVTAGTCTGTDQGQQDCSTDGTQTCCVTSTGGSPTPPVTTPSLSTTPGVSIGPGTPQPGRGKKCTPAKGILGGLQDLFHLNQSTTNNCKEDKDKEEKERKEHEENEKEHDRKVLSDKKCDRDKDDPEECKRVERKHHLPTDRGNNRCDNDDNQPATCKQRNVAQIALDNITNLFFTLSDSFTLMFIPAASSPSGSQPCVSPSPAPSSPPTPTQSPSPGISTTPAQTGTKHYEYIVDAGSVSVFDIDNNFTQVNSISLPSTSDGVRGVDACPAKSMLYVSHGTDGGPSGSLLGYNLITKQVVFDVKYSHGIDQFGVTPDCSRIYMPGGEVANDTNWYVEDGMTGQETGVKINGGAGPHNTIVSPDGNTVYMGPRQSNYLAVAPTSNNTVSVRVGPFTSGGTGMRPFTINTAKTIVYAAKTAFLGFEVGDLTTGKVLYSVPVPGFTYNPSNDPATTPSHGIALSPDSNTIYVLDQYNNYIHVFDVSQVPSSAPVKIADIKLQTPLIGNESPCAYDCLRDGWLQLNNDGKYLFVGDSGDVIDTSAKKVITTLQSLKNSRHGLIEIDWNNGIPVFTTTAFSVGRR